MENKEWHAHRARRHRGRYRAPTAATYSSASLSQNAGTAPPAHWRLPLPHPIPPHPHPHPHPPSPIPHPPSYLPPPTHSPYGTLSVRSPCWRAHAATGMAVACWPRPAGRSPGHTTSSRRTSPGCGPSPRSDSCSARRLGSATPSVPKNATARPAGVVADVAHPRACARRAQLAARHSARCASWRDAQASAVGAVIAQCLEGWLYFVCVITRADPMSERPHTQVERLFTENARRRAHAEQPLRVSP